MADWDQITEPFTPGVTVSLACTVATAVVAITNADGKVKQQVRLHNSGTTLMFYKIVAAAGTAALTDTPLPAGMVEVVTIPPAAGVARYIAAIMASGTATLYATVGQGV